MAARSTERSAARAKASSIWSSGNFESTIPAKGNRSRLASTKSRAWIGWRGRYCGRSGPLAGISRQGRILLYCAVGERSTLAVEIAAELGLTGFAHIPGGFTAWTKAGGPVEQVG